MKTKQINTPKKKTWMKDRRKVLFYVLMLALPVLQVVIFYIGVNIRSVFLAFQKYDANTDSLVFAGFENFIRVFNFNNGNALSELSFGFKNSLISYAIGVTSSICIGLPLAYAVYRKVPFHGSFKVFLYLPHMLSVVVMSVMFMNFTEEALPHLLPNIFPNGIGPLSGRDEMVIYATLMFFTVFIALGGNLLLYTGAMSDINVSLIESAQLDGANSFRVFWHVFLPGIWPTISTLLVVGLTGIFINQINLFTFYGTGAPSKISTIGYWLYKLTYRATGANNPFLEYPYLAAVGIVLTCITVPLTLGARKLMSKLGPRDD